MNRGTRRVHALLLTLALSLCAALVILLTAYSPCQSAYVIGCSPFPDAAPRQ